MTSAVADTHAALWYLTGDLRLSGLVKSIVDGTARSRGKIAISSISLAEVVCLVDKGRVPQSAYDDLRTALADPVHVFAEAVFNVAVVQAMRLVSRLEEPDMPDRMIAATAVHLRVPVISRDRRIRASNLQTIW